MINFLIELVKNYQNNVGFAIFFIFVLAIYAIVRFRLRDEKNITHQIKIIDRIMLFATFFVVLFIFTSNSGKQPVEDRGGDTSISAKDTVPVTETVHPLHFFPDDYHFDRVISLEIAGIKQKMAIDGTWFIQMKKSDLLIVRLEAGVVKMKLDKNLKLYKID